MEVSIERKGAKTMNVEELVMELWKEQILRGICSKEEINSDGIALWIANRTYPMSILEDACKGDSYALAIVRQEAGLPPIA